MFQSYVLALFLYFPEDKTEYIPATITLVIFSIGALIAMKFIVRKSRQEEAKAKKLEEKLLNNLTDNEKKG